MTLGMLPVALFVGLLIAAAIGDLVSYTIPNVLTVSVAGAYIVYALVVSMPPQLVGIHVLTGIGALVLGVAFFAFGFVGGGDAKLFAAAALWFGWPDILSYALTLSMIGGGLTLAILAFRQVILPPFLCGRQWILRLHAKQSGIPYGVAIGSGALIIIPCTDILRRAIG